MKLQHVMLSALLIVGCSGEAETEKILAQCQLDAYGSTGSRFRGEFFSFRDDPEVKSKEAYHAFVKLCMKSKGFYFDKAFDGANWNLGCWNRGQDFANYSIPISGNPECYRKRLW